MGNVSITSFDPVRDGYEQFPLDGPVSPVYFGGMLYLSAPPTIFGQGPGVILGEQISGTLSLPTPTPLPPALSMFGSALLALVGFAAWRSWRSRITDAIMTNFSKF